MLRVDRHGELMGVEEAWHYICGAEPGKGSVIGREKLRALMRRGFIRSVVSGNARQGQKGVAIVTRRKYLDEFLEQIFTEGLTVPDLGIEFIPFPEERQHARN